MFKIDEIRVENLIKGCVTDKKNPVISFSMSSDKQDVVLENAIVKIGDWEKQVNYPLNIMYDGTLEPFTMYEVEICACDNYGEESTAKTAFQTGRLSLPWKAKWITDTDYQPKKKCSPVPMTMRTGFAVKKDVKKAYVTATAMGIYDLELNGRRITEEYFAPGLTSYKHTLQYNYYDVTDFLSEENSLLAIIGGGWAVGRFTYESKNQITVDRQAFLMELFIEYVDGSMERICTDSSWEITYDGNYRYGDFYDGEVYDATINWNNACWKQAIEVSPPITPAISVRYGCPVTAHKTLRPMKIFTSPHGECIYDFGQNFAGVVNLKIDGKKGQKINVRHAEVLHEGELYVDSLRTAKAGITYICEEGRQIYTPRLTYMGFRYVGIRGIEADKIQVSANALYSDIDEIGSFSCSNPMLNLLQNNILWSAKSNFVDIPTDCPQRDERQGWTGDISVFSSTACYNFDLSRFMDKWLLDVMHEQGKGGGLPFVIPKQGASAPIVPTACWGDCCIIVPWALYLSNGDKGILRRQYPMMKRYLKSVKFWAGLGSVGKQKYIWKWLFQFGDWCAPEGYVSDWMKRGKWIATAYYAYCAKLMSRIADVLGELEDSEFYQVLATKICNAYIDVFTDGEGRLKNEFQTAYVLPLAFDMVDGTTKNAMVEHLVRLIREKDWHLSTGFPATPFILFALCDAGRVEEAYKLLLQDTCPSWGYEVKCGATTFWERWDAMRPDGTLNLTLAKDGKTLEGPGTCSLNHYAYGAVGDFLYRRILGIEAISGGYEMFRIKPVVGGELTYAEGAHKTPFGKIKVEWHIQNDTFELNFEVPVGTRCQLVMPSGKTQIYGSGKYRVEEPYKKGCFD